VDYLVVAKLAAHTEDVGLLCLAKGIVAGKSGFLGRRQEMSLGSNSFGLVRLWFHEH